MKKRSPVLIAIAMLASLSITVPPELGAQAASKAGEIARVIPDVGINRGAQTLPAPVKTLVDWGDVVRTGDGGRARVALDDGSILNVGSSSSLTVTQHNAAAQQTQIELEYGRVRSQVVKQSKPNSKFEIHTAVGVAGVVGTDFFLGFENGIFQIIVYEGTVKFCNLDGVCVTVGAGQTATIRDGHQPPDQPSLAAPSELTAAAIATSVGATSTGTGALPVHHIGTWWVVGLTLAVAVPAIVIPVAMRNGSGSTVIGAIGKGGCSQQNPSAC
jgi:hypothetical protein